VGGVQRPVGVAQQLAGQQHRVGVAFGDYLLEMPGFGS
jgi:hypothetical protein